jgi:hypothetical protein
MCVKDIIAVTLALEMSATRLRKVMIEERRKARE